MQEINFENELNRAKEKIINGAICLFTQPIYSKRNADNLLLAKKSLSCKILAGIMPIASYKNALFLNNEVAFTSMALSGSDDYCMNYINFTRNTAK